MSRLHRYVTVALVLQVAMVLVGQTSSRVLGMSGVFGMGIPLVVGWLYTARRGLTLKEASTGGMWIGAVGAAVGLLVAIPLNGDPWSLLPLGTLASTATGWLGAFLGWTLKARRSPSVK
jgi:hypothetical protein